MRDRTLELYGKHYTISWPHEEHSSARNIYKSELYDVLKSRGAVFGSKFGWERPNWFAPEGTEAKDIHSFGWPNWHDQVGFEHKNIRENVALIDQSSFSKFEVTGKDAFDFLQKLAVNNIDKPPGNITYTQLCNQRGGIESDVTIQRLEENLYYIITGTSFGTHDLNWIRENLPANSDIQIKTVTHDRAVLNICGPNSRKVLEKVTKDDVSNESLKFGQCKYIDINGSKVNAVRVTYVGELGWELHMKKEYVLNVYNSLWEAGQEFKIINAGYRAIETCRLEKGYRYWSTDLSPDYNPYEAGLGFCVNLNKEDFIGKEALAKVKAEGIKRKLCCFTLDKTVPLYGKETIFHNGEIVGVVSSGGFGHTVAKTIVYAYIPKAHLGTENYEIEVLGERIPITRHKKTLYDPKRERVLS